QPSDLRMGPLDRMRGASAFVGEGGRHADIQYREIGAVARHRGRQVLGGATGSHPLVAADGEQPRQTFAQEYLVLSDHDPHGSSAISVVPLAGMLSICSRPPWAA